jgi:hypothetical protein
MSPSNRPFHRGSVRSKYANCERERRREETVKNNAEAGW